MFVLGTLMSALDHKLEPNFNLDWDPDSAFDATPDVDPVSDSRFNSQT